MADNIPLADTATPPAALSPVDPVAEVYQSISSEATRLIAAALADRAFPQENHLPRLAPIPYNHLGHQVLLDYGSLASILWGAVHEIQEIYRGSPWRWLAPLLGLGLAMAGVCLGAGLWRQAADLGYVVVAVAAGVLFGAVAYGTTRPRIARIAAGVRARHMRLLLQGSELPSAAAFKAARLAQRRLAEFGDGKLGKDRCPVLVMTGDDQPFPAFGRHQARQLFVCRPGDEKSPPRLSPEDLNTSVAEALLGMADNLGLSCVSSGSVIVVDGRTLRKDSRWLALGADGNGSHPMLPPVLHQNAEEDNWGRDDMLPLYLPESRLPFVQSVDGRASVRVYTCIQAVAPEYLMCLTFFVRTFLAGKSAACEVNVSTLGPPAFNWDSVRDRLRVYEWELRGRRADPYRLSPAPARITPLGARLRRIGLALGDAPSPFQDSTDKPEVLHLEPFDEEANFDEKRQVDRIAGKSQLWPGSYTAMTNWREWYSLTFTSDFFGNTESRALLKTLYDRICRSALGHLKGLGFDISDYQDESGKFSINADSIEHLVVGERVYVDQQANKALERQSMAAEARAGAAEVKT